MEDNTAVSGAPAAEVAVPAIPKQLYSIRPRNEWVAVRKITQDEVKTDSGIILDKSQARTVRAIVVSLGTKVQDLKIGDEVLISNFAMELEDVEEMTGVKDLVIVREEEVYAVGEPIIAQD
jgi:co-chaperonin GroES (HSP10)